MKIFRPGFPPIDDGTRSVKKTSVKPVKQPAVQQTDILGYTGPNAQTPSRAPHSINQIPEVEK